MRLWWLGAVLFGVLASAASIVDFVPPYVPAHFPPPVYDFRQNPLDSAKIELGRALFFDPQLSADNTISCASCHSPYNAFAHTDHAVSHGIGDAIGRRNAPALFNLAWRNSFMRDGAVRHLDLQALAPIEHVGEMAEDFARVVDKLRADKRYVAGFVEAYPDGGITGERVLKCLAQFQLTLVSTDAKYDRVQTGLDTFTAQETSGFRVFEQHCNSCHRAPLFAADTFASHGLPIDPKLRDYGRMEVTGLASDSLLVKVPSLRNLKYTYPYMHDGRFASLGQVLRQYSETQAPLGDRERTDLQAFLLTLNDESFVFDRRHQFPRDFFFASGGSAGK